MNFTYAAYACLALAATALFVRLWMMRRQPQQHQPTVVHHPWTKPEWNRKRVATPLAHIHILRVGRSSIHKLTEGVSMRCCVAGCEEPFYMDGPTVDWMRDWLNATKVDSVKVQAIR